MGDPQFGVCSEAVEQYFVVEKDNLDGNNHIAEND